ncbi:MAG: hypothetical protein ACLVB5_13370 [Christensenellales bacterium]
MRVSSFSNVPFIPPIAPQAAPPQAPCAPPAPAAFLPFSAQAFDQARLRDVPVLLFICDAPPSFADAALNMQIFERTVPVWLYPACGRMWSCSVSARAHCFPAKARCPCAR